MLSHIREKDLKRHKQSYFSDLEGEMVIRDMSKKYSSYRLYIEGVTNSPMSEFIKPELITVIASMLPTMPKPLLGEGLVSFHEQHTKKNKLTIEWLDLIVVHCFEQVIADPKISKKLHNIPELLVYMKSLYMASKSKGDVEKMRIIGEKFIKKHVKQNNPSQIASIRTGIMLYIIVRMLSKDHYG